MADPIQFEGVTHHFGPPPGLEEMIGSLYVFQNGRTVVSAWMPSAEELAKLNAGEAIFVSVMSGASVFPMFVGTEDQVKAVASDTGRVW